MREFVGKAAFVTGGASGIGLALGRAFAEAGCKVMLADIEKAALDAAVASLSGSGQEVRGIVCDVADTASVDAAAEATFSAFGKVHILCNNAGVGARGGIDHIALDNWRWVLDVNLMGVVNGVRAFLPHMRAHGEGSHIVNTASMAGVVSSHQGFAPYPASKYAVVGMSVRGAGCRVEAFWDWREHIVSGNRPHKHPGKRPQSPPTLWTADTRGPVKPALCSICRTGPHWHGPCGGGATSRGRHSQ